MQSVINTAPDSLFVAVGIGYGFEEERGRPLRLALERSQGDRRASWRGDAWSIAARCAD